MCDRAARILLIFLCIAPAAARAQREVATDLLIVGGTESGWAAAIQAARMKVPSITVVHDGNWLGGQFTEQALACVDENKGVGRVGWGVDWHPMKRSFHRSGLFKELMDRIEAFNEEKYGAKMPGKPWHGPSTFRPAEAEKVFRDMIRPYVQTGQIEIFWNYYPAAANVRPASDGKRKELTEICFRSLVREPELKVAAKLTIDASDWGEAIQVAEAEFECGPDPRSRYGESAAPEDLSAYPPNEMNPITWAMIVEQAGEESPIERPQNFDDRNYARTSRISLESMRDLKWDRPVRLGSIPAWPVAGKENASPRQLSVYNVRRVIDGYTSKEAQTVILLNYMLGQDYPLERLPQRVIDALEEDEPDASKKNIVTMTREQREIIFADAKQHALGVLYHLQNFVHQRAGDTAHSFRHFRLSDEFGTPDKLPPKPYIRESLRLKAMYMMREQDGRNTNGPTKQFAREQYARIMYPDGILAWQFHYDFHRTGRAYLVDEGQDGPWIDFEKQGRNTHILSDRSLFPLRSLIPIEMDGLIGAQKNIGYSSIVSAAIRLHDQCIHIGQAAGATAAVSLRESVLPRQIPHDRRLLELVRTGLCGTDADAVPMLLWPFRDLPATHPHFVAINRLAARFAFPLARSEVDFHPELPADPAWRAAVAERSLATKVFEKQPPIPNDEMTRGQFAERWWRTIEPLTDRPFPRISPQDADGDGIADAHDALPFSAATESWPPESIPAAADGRPDKAAGNESARQFNFAGQDDPQPPGFTNDHGLPFDLRRGFGWSRDISANYRRRRQMDGVYRDTFLFTRTHDVWELAVDNGHYTVTVCIGDSGHPQFGQNVTIEGRRLFEDHDTATGRFAEGTAQVEVTDGRLTVEIGKPGGSTNTCLNWLQVSRVVKVRE